MPSVHVQPYPSSFTPTTAMSPLDSSVPGTLLSSVLIALIGVHVLGYGWTWTEGMVFGTMLSATDPVAVVALLKEMGAPEDLGVLIESESLLNDGVAFALFLVFHDMMLKGATYTAGAAAGKLVYMSAVGCAVGVAFGMAAIFALGFARA